MMTAIGDVNALAVFAVFLQFLYMQTAQELAGMRPGSAGAVRRTMLLPSKVALKAGFVTMARHPYGCRVVQRILEHCDIEPYTKALLEEVRASPDRLP